MEKSLTEKVRCRVVGFSKEKHFSSLLFFETENTHVRFEFGQFLLRTKKGREFDVQIKKLLRVKSISQVYKKRVLLLLNPDSERKNSSVVYGIRYKKEEVLWL